MSESPWFKLFPSDFIDGTLGLSFEEKGAYLLALMMIYHRGGPLPDDDRFIAGTMGVSVRRWRGLKATLIGRGKLTLEDGKLFNRRAAREIAHRSEISRKRAEAGAKSKLSQDNPEKNAGKSEEKSVEKPTGGLKMHGFSDANAQTKQSIHVRASESESYKKAASQDLGDGAPANAAPPGFREAQSVDLIATLDDEIERRYGASQRRPWPDPHDMPVAMRWLGDGIEPQLIREVIAELVARQSGRAKPKPLGLRYFDKAVRERALERQSREEDTADRFTAEEHAEINRARIRLERETGYDKIEAARRLRVEVIEPIIERKRGHRDEDEAPSPDDWDES